MRCSSSRFERQESRRRWTTRAYEENAGELVRVVRACVVRVDDVAGKAGGDVSER